MKFKLSKLFILVFILFVSVIFMSSCSATAPDGSDYSAKGDAAPPNGDEEEQIIEPGQLTACAYNDNDHFSFWQSLLTSTQEGPGLFESFYDNFLFKTANRIKIKVPSNMDVIVHLVDDQNNILFTSIPDATGIAYLYSHTKQESYNICLEYKKLGESEVTKQYEVVTEDTEFILDATSEKSDTIQLMFVIDTTGSMGDEIRYLTAEVIDIIDKVKLSFPTASLELAIMVYRDRNDEYLTNYSDFTTDIISQQMFLSKQRASGGGDFEEAVDVAMEEAAEKQWSSSAKTKILVHVADAPSHDNDVASWNESSLKFAEMGVRVITVASSGINKKTEYLFRSQSILTNGMYVYLTNDSGIGNDHLEATVEERPTVEYLNASLVRLIKGYHTGVFEEAIYYLQQQN